MLRIGNKETLVKLRELGGGKKCKVQYFTELDQNYAWWRKNAPARISRTENWITELLSPFKLSVS